MGVIAFEKSDHKAESLIGLETADLVNRIGKFLIFQIC